MLLSYLKRPFQKVLIGSYNLAVSFGFVDSGPGRFLYRQAYFIYKRHLEAGPVIQLRKLVAPGSWVVDVGANIGFFSVLFCQWISAGGQVIALEPEARNFRMLCGTIGRWRQQGLAEALGVAVDSADGVAKLLVNPAHPGDHKLGDHGLEVETVTIDTLLEERRWPAVSLIKIDVQGAEMRVLAGAARTIERLAPAFFVEMDAEALARFASSPEEIFSLFAAAGYTAHALEKHHLSPPIDWQQLQQLTKNQGYTDLLFLPRRLHQCP